MRVIVHMSDLHFGAVDEPLLKPLAALTHEVRPQVVVVSGDLTQRARSAEFRAARAFLESLPAPQIVVPGNHDVPLYNLYARFVEPLHKYRRHITEDLEPFYSDAEVAVLGVNTARSLTIKDGRINVGQIEGIRSRMCPLGAGVTKILVTHHPFDVPEHSRHQTIVGRAHLAMEAIAACGVDVVLSGHLHLSHTGHSAKRFRANGHSSLLVQAGTATSTRARGEPNSFNVIRIDGSRLSVECLSWQPPIVAFGVVSTEHFEKSEQGWVRLPEPRPPRLA
jgi:3',5'-cyclic AMP phosphodiesterase CpdA